MSRQGQGIGQLDMDAVDHFKQYLRLDTVHPDVDYTDCLQFLGDLADGMGLPWSVVWVGEGKERPVLVVTWSGSQPQLPSLLLSSHMDVVPVFPDQWTHEPFSAHEDSAGNIYARGTQDMKSVGIQYLEAIRRLILEGFTPKRSVHLSFTSDEEIGLLGMIDFVKTEEFKKLNVGCALDEGVASPDESYNLYYAERKPYTHSITLTGTPGHGSLLLDNTAGEKLNKVLDKMYCKRSEEKKRLEDNPELKLGDVTTINLTMVEGGVQTNVVPPELKVAFDCRLSCDQDWDEFGKWIESVCKESGEGVHVNPISRKLPNNHTDLISTNLWWMAFKKTFDEMNLKLNTLVFPANTDLGNLRNLGIPGFGYSPMNNTPVLLHDHNEFINREVFLRGIEIYKKLIVALTNV